MGKYPSRIIIPLLSFYILLPVSNDVNWGIYFLKIKYVITQKAVTIDTFTTKSIIRIASVIGRPIYPSIFKIASCTNACETYQKVDSDNNLGTCISVDAVTQNESDKTAAI